MKPPEERLKVQRCSSRLEDWTTSDPAHTLPFETLQKKDCYCLYKVSTHMEEGMASHSSTVAWRISWTEEPGRLQSIGSQSWTWLKRLCTIILEGHLVYIFWSSHTNFSFKTTLRLAVAPKNLSMSYATFPFEASLIMEFSFAPHILWTQVCMIVSFFGGLY